MDDKMKKIMIGCGAGFVVLFIILALLSSCQKSRTYTYEEVEQMMLDAAKKYYEKNEEELPTEDKDTSEYDLKDMISDGYLKETSELLGESSPSCEGAVTVINNNGYYLYTVQFECGEEYTTKTLKETIIENSTVETGHGLYELEDEYVFKGDKVDNWVSFAGQTWRIVGINKDGNIKLVANSTKVDSEWDRHFNPIVNQNGVNDYYLVENDRGSTVKDRLEEYYKDELYFNDNDRAFMTTQTICIGKRSPDDTTKNGETECTNTIDKQNFGLLAVYEVLRASLDPYCNATTDISCNNYNWALTLDKNTWLVTASTTKTTKVYELTTKKLIETSAQNSVKILPTVAIDQRVSYTQGSGTEEDPYIIGEVTEED